LPAKLAALASSLGAGFFDSGAVASPSPVDGIHLDPASHERLGLALAARVKEIGGSESLSL